MRYRLGPVLPALGVIVSLASVPATGATPAPAATPTRQSSRTHPPFASARSCGACHDTIHKAWAESAHARAATNAAWLEALQRAVEPAADKKAARTACVWCHAPTTLVTGDVD